jgi:heptosyltransferase-2
VELQSILVIQTAFLGDVLLTIPFLKFLRRHYPKAELLYCARRNVAQVLLELGLIDQLFEIDKGQESSYAQARRRIPNHLDRVFCIHESFRSKIFSFRISAGRKIGFKGFLSSLIFDDSVEKPKEYPEVLRVFSLLKESHPDFWVQVQKKMRAQSPYALDDKMKLIFPIGDYSMGMRAEIMNFLGHSSDFPSEMEKYKTERPRVLIFPGSVWATKKWTLQGFRELTRTLSGSYQVILMGSSGESNLCEEVKGQSSAVNLAGKTTLMETLFWMVKSNLVIGNDSGSAHLASVAEVPSLTIFGPTILEFGYRPWSDQATIIQPAPLTCRPCGTHGHSQCPLGTHECMQSISSDRVLRVALDLLRKN